jgi:hypothetical protein
MSKKTSSAFKRKAPLSPPPPPPSGDDVLGDLIDSDFDVVVQPDGRVNVHAKCKEGDDPSAAAERVRFLVEALGAEMVPPPELPR